MRTAGEYELMGSKTEGLPFRHASDGAAGRTPEDLIPVLFEMAKSVMRLRCAMVRGEPGSNLSEELPVLESAVEKMALKIETLRG